VDKISAQAVRDTIRIGMDACFACFVRCKKKVQTERVDSAYGGPEMETLAALGSNCGIDDLEAIAKGSELCNAYSLDTISTGSTIAFIMECFENGLLTVEDTGGLKLRFGDAEIMIQLIEKIAHREGIGDLLAEGSARAAEKVGKGAGAFAMHVKKQEFPMHSPRVNRAGAVGYAVNPTGADHCSNLLDMVYTAYASEPEFTVPDAEALGYTEPVAMYELSPRKMTLLRIVRLKRMLLDSLILCTMIPYSYKQITRLVAAVTGWDTTEMELLRIAERSMNMHQLFNTRRGFTARDDEIPDRFFEPVKTGPLADKPPFLKEDFEKAKRSYYRLMGWDESGIPYPEKLAELEVPE
jgi:aldehyde:ferredoxin oxidoreductase